MRRYLWSPKSGFSDAQSGIHVELSDIHNAIVTGDRIQVRNAETGDDATQQVLLDLLHDGATNKRDTDYVVRLLETAVRLSNVSDTAYTDLTTNTDSSTVALTDVERDSIRVWMRCMEDYGDIWQEDFGWAYFSQEYWYLLIKTIACHWREEPLNVQAACRAMKNGSRRTRESRLNHILAENWIVKRSDPTDHRKIWVQPTEDMLELCRVHLWRSLRHLVEQGSHLGILHAGELSTVFENLNTEEDANDKTFLLPWAEFLTTYTDNWNTTFHNRFPTEDYWYLFSHTLLAHWQNQPLTIRETSERMKAGTVRTRETKIHRAIAAQLIERTKHDGDMRIALVTITPLLEKRLCIHFNTTLQNFIQLTSDLLHSPVCH